jgi:hypothetical protein
MPIDLTQGVLEDLRALRRDDPDAFAAVIVFIDEAAVDEALIWQCTDDQDLHLTSTRAGVRRWVAAEHTIGNLFRVRIFDTPATVYRVIYGLDWQAGRIGLLAIAHKDQFNYEVTGDLADRIHADWHCATDGRCP